MKCAHLSHNILILTVKTLVMLLKGFVILGNLYTSTDLFIIPLQLVSIYAFTTDSYNI